MSKKIGRNDPCPCGSGKKYKYCCSGVLDWPSVFQHGYGAVMLNLSTRGKNLHFLKRLAGALQLDKFATGDPSHFKAAFTGKAVREIYEAVAEVWPSSDDLNRVLRSESAQTSGLYVGHYEPEIIERAVTRHTIYSDTILLLDPFTHPKFIRAEYNPLSHPEHYRPTALRCALLWIHLWPWIEAGLVRFIRTPGDLDLKVAHESMNIQEARFKSNPELKMLAEAVAKSEFQDARELKESTVLLHKSDDALRSDYRECFPGRAIEEEQAFIQFIRERRKRNPYYMEPIPDASGDYAQLQITSSGASYDMAKRIAAITKSHLITDLPTRWKEMEIDRSDGNVDDRQWSPFAKAFHNVNVPYLENVPLGLALKLREEDRLAEMRGFMRKVWKAAAPENSFAEGNADNLAAELREKVREAGEEWEKIDRDLLKWIGITTAGSFVTFGGAEWVSAALGSAIGGVGSLVIARHQRHSFERRYPAAFLLKLKQHHSRTKE